MFDLSPVRTNSRASRNLIFSIPVQDYCFDINHINVTLQSMLDVVVNDLNVLSTSGLKFAAEVS